MDANKDLVRSMFKKTAARPFKFGSGYSMRATALEDEIYVEYMKASGEVAYRIICKDTEDASYSIDELFDEMIADFVLCYRRVWTLGAETDVFGAFAGPDDEGLREVLEVFGKDYKTFQNATMYWFSLLFDDEDDGCEDEVDYDAAYYPGTEYVPPGEKMTSQDRIIKTVVERIATCPIWFINKMNHEYCWQIAVANNRFWYWKRKTSYCEGVIAIEDEFGDFAKDDQDAFNALRDAISNSFYEDDNWTLIGDDNPDKTLSIVGLSKEILTV